MQGEIITGPGNGVDDLRLGGRNNPNEYWSILTRENRPRTGSDWKRKKGSRGGGEAVKERILEPFLFLKGGAL